MPVPSPSRLQPHSGERTLSPKRGPHTVPRPSPVASPCSAASSPRPTSRLRSSPSKTQTSILRDKCSSWETPVPVSSHPRPCQPKAWLPWKWLPVGTQPARAREAHLHLSAAAEPQRSWEPLLGPRMLTTHQKEKPHRALPPPHCPPNSVLPRENLLPAVRPGCDPAAQGGSREAPGLYGAGQEGVAQSWSPAKAPGGTLRSHPARPLGPPATCKAVGQQYRLMPLPSEASPGQASGKRPDPGQGQWPHSEAGRGGMDGRQGGRGVGRSASAETGAGSAPGVPTNSPETRAERLPLPAATQALCVPAAGGGGCPGRSGRPPALEAAAGSVAGRSH